MHIYLACTAGDRPMFEVQTEHPKSLFSFAYAHTEAGRAPVFNAPNARILVDSGAYTAHTLGKQYHPREYAAWAHAFTQRLPNTVTSLRFCNLDVIGDQDATWKNHARLQRYGLNPIAVVTYGADLKHLHRALEYDYIALGGLVPHARHRSRLQAWLDQCYQIISRHYHDTGVMPRTHLLGITQAWALNRYPVYSADSSSWVAPIRFGGNLRAGTSLPSWSKHLDSNLHVLRQEVRKYKRMEQEATALWAKRGITWKA